MIFKQSPWIFSLEGQENIIKDKKKRLFLSFKNWKHEKKNLYFSNCPKAWKTLVKDVALHCRGWLSKVAEYTEVLSQNWTMTSNLDNFGHDGNVISGNLINWHFVKIKHLVNSKPNSLHFSLDNYENRGLWMHSDFHSIIRNQFTEMLEITDSVPWQLSWKNKVLAHICGYYWSVEKHFIQFLI